MFTVQYTVAKTVKSNFKNIYKNEILSTLRQAELLANNLKKKSNVTDVRIVQTAD